MNMKKIKTINKLLSSLTLLSSLLGIGFNSQYQSTQKVITRNSNNSSSNYVRTNAEPVQMGDIWVTVDNSDPTIITGYSSGTGTLEVTSDITEIGDGAFYRKDNITSLNLSQATSLTTIATDAFQECENLIGNITIPSSVTSIGNQAFYGCRLTGNLVIPSSVTSIGERAFGNTNFTEISVDSSNQNYCLATNLGSDAYVVLSGTNGTWNVDSEVAGQLACGKLIIPSNITQIQTSAFSHTNITSLDLSQPTSLTTIGEYAFNNCKNLTGDLVIPSSVTSIGNWAFDDTKITSLDLSQPTSLTSIGNNAFQFCSNLTGNIIIPSSVTSIGSSAFYKTGITSLDLSQATSLTNIGDRAFEFCSNLTGDLVIPSSVTNIGTFAFAGAKITSLDLSQATSLTTIGNYAFEHCSNLSGDIVIPSNVTSIGKEVFENSTIDNLYFLSETPPTSFGSNWQPTVTGKVYVPSEVAKEAYLGAPSFGFSTDQVEIGLPPEPTPTPKKSNTGLILGLLFGLGIPIILATGFGIRYFTKKKNKKNANKKRK